jgi:hypothetical protein
LFDEYEKYICSPSNPYSKKYDSFGDVWMRLLSTDDKTISFSLSKNFYQKDTPCNLALKTLAQSVQLRRGDESGPFTCASFLISDGEFDTIRIGLFPLRSYGDYASEYYLAEPMVLNAGLLVVSSKPEWIGLCMMNVLKRVVDHVANPQIAGSYFDTFIAMKFAWDERFRTKVLELAKADTFRMDEKRWLNEVHIPRGILPIHMNAADSSVLDMFFTGVSDKVLMPSVYAGPDVMMGIFLVGNKFCSSQEKVSSSESRKNGETTDPRLLYGFRGRKRLNGFDEIEVETEMPPKRQLLREQAKNCYSEMSLEKKGHVILRFEYLESHLFQRCLQCILDLILCMMWSSFLISITLIKFLNKRKLTLFLNF